MGTVMKTISADALLSIVDSDTIFQFLRNWVAKHMLRDLEEIQACKDDIACLDPGYKYHAVEYRAEMKRWQKRLEYHTKASKLFNQIEALTDKADAVWAKKSRKK